MTKLIPMKYAQLWKMSVENTQPQNIDNISKEEWDKIDNDSKRFGPLMTFGADTDGHPIITFTDGSKYQILTRTVE